MSSTLLLYTNIVICGLVTFRFTGGVMTSELLVGRILVGALAIVTTANYQYLLARKRFERIKIEFGDLNEEEMRRSRAFTIGYVVLSLALLWLPVVVPP